MKNLKKYCKLILQQWNILSWHFNLTNRIPIWNSTIFPEEGGFHDIHNNNHISGFYFLKCNEKTSHPVFHTDLVKV